jgi:hypothetical protein
MKAEMDMDLDRMRFWGERKSGESREEFDKRIVLEDFHNKVTGNPLLTEETVNRIIEKSVKDYEDDPYRKYSLSDTSCVYMPEGIDLNYRNGTISYNPKHEDYVSTSVETNPTQDKSFGNDVQVWSIFKRNVIDNFDDLDGNPLVYALKKEKNEYGQLKWRFNPKNDEYKIMNQVTLIIDKFNKSHQYGTTVVVPSSSVLNNTLANLVQERNPNAKIMNDLLRKLSTEEVVDEATMPGSKFQQIYNTNEKFNRAIKLLQIYIREMNTQKGGNFTFHFIKDNKMRGAIAQSLKLSKGADKIYASDINDKDILIIDDSLSQGNTIKHAIELIKSTFTPKSISVLTLFSKL